MEAGGGFGGPRVPSRSDRRAGRWPGPAPAAPSTRHWLGTDDQGRDLLARLVYGFRISVLFGLVLTLASSLVGVAAGAGQGYFGGWTDLDRKSTPLNSSHPIISDAVFFFKKKKN